MFYVSRSLFLCFSTIHSFVFHVVLLKWLLYLFISSIRSSSFHLLSLSSLLVSRFFHLFLTILNFLFLVKFIVQKNLFRLLQHSLFLSSLFHQNLSFLCFFLLCFFQTNLFFHVLFFCLLKNGLSFCLTLLFLILLVNSVSFFFTVLFFDVSKNKKSCFLMELMEKLSFVFSFCSLVFFFLKHNVCAKKSVVFSIIFETVKILFSLHFKAQKKRQKTFIFSFCPVPLFDWFFSFNIFPFFFSFITVVFVHFFLFISLFISTCFALLFLSLFSPTHFSILALFFSISVFLFLFFPVSHVSLSFFLQRRFLCILFSF